MNSQKLMDYIHQNWEQSVIPTLCQYIEIPNKSPFFDAQWQQHGYMTAAVELVAKWCKQNSPRGMQLEIVNLPGKTPLLYVEIPGTGCETVLLYGHLDKQPEMVGWDADLNPWQAVRKQDRLYGRGGADDGYAVFACITAINALQQQNISHARCVVLIECCEESGSQDLPFYIDYLQQRIGSPSLIICLDSGCGNYEQLWMTTSLRGNLIGELRVELLTEGVHSGAASGIAADSFRVARQLLSRIEDELTGEILPSEFSVEIPIQRIEQAKICAEVLQQHIYSEYPFYSGVKPVSQDLVTLLLNRTWKATLTVTGAEGIPALENAGNVLRPFTSLKLSLRIPPTCEPEVAEHAICKYLLMNTPYNAKVQFTVKTAAPGWNAPPLAPWLEQACETASQTYFGKTAVYLGEGGTIPFMGMLGKKFPEAQFMITGVLGPKANAHGPNEFLHLPMAEKLTACVASVIADHHSQGAEQVA